MAEQNNMYEFLMSHPTDPAGAATHGISIGTIFASFLGWLPGFVALIPAFYYILLIYESKTVQRFLRKRRLWRRFKKSAKRRAAHKLTSTQQK